jgi:NADH:ubiquinone reductase (H+-translocating)
MSDIVGSVDAPQRGGAGESKSEQVPRRLSGKHKPRVVIVGGGFAGVAAAKSLRGCDADVTLIDRRNCWHRPRLPLRSPTARLKRSAISFPTPLAIYIATSFAR